MIRLEEKYAQAVAFRKRGFTYSEIAKIVDVSKSTVGAWLSKKAFSSDVKKANVERAHRENKKRLTLINKARKAERAHTYLAAEKSALTEYRHYKSSPLFLAGLMLYVAVGDQKDKSMIRMSSGRIDLHSIFIRFLLEYMGIEKKQIRFWLLLYPDLDEVKCMKKWSKSLGLSPLQFYKNQVIGGRSKKQTVNFGVGNMLLRNSVQKRKLIRWLELFVRDVNKVYK